MKESSYYTAINFSFNPIFSYLYIRVNSISVEKTFTFHYTCIYLHYLYAVISNVYLILGEPCSILKRFISIYVLWNFDQKQIRSTFVSQIQMWRNFTFDQKVSLHTIARTQSVRHITLKLGVKRHNWQYLCTVRIVYVRGQHFYRK